MATDPLVHARILERVGRDELRRCCNSVLQDEVSALQRAVSEVVAVFAKVEEVRDAVNQLEQGKPSTGRSASLMDAMSNTMELQKDLEETLKKVAMGMVVYSETEVASSEAEQTHGKRKRSVGATDQQKQQDSAAFFESSSGESSSSSPSSSSSEEEEEEVEPTLTKKKKQRAGSDDAQTYLQTLAEALPLSTGDPTLPLARECLRTISSVKTVDGKIQFATKTRWSKAVNDIKKILQQQACCDANMADNAAARMTALALEAAAVIFKQLEWTAEHTYEVQSLVAALLSACARKMALERYFHRAGAKLEKLETQSFHSMEYKATTGNDTELLDRLLWTYRGLVKGTLALPDSEKPQRIAETLSMLETVMRVDSECKYANDVRDAMELVSGWVSKIELSEYLGHKIRRFANKVEFYIKNMKVDDVGLRRLAANIPNLVDARAKQQAAGRTANKAITRTSTKTTAVMESLVWPLSQLKQWQVGVFSQEQLTKVIHSLGRAVSYKANDWNPRTDPTVRDCVERLVSCIKRIDELKVRKKLMRKVKSWGMSKY
ncbi:hypothetical protein PHYPSEUDO_004648 [Phytophthora pseudosyringae]|uniref:Uncharacterized protein n=1 Tax=Phytophthora pseudosyringae TaxID=221518 RepID=A0A8T1VR09_9STRA|nr:hypothetical protein PHYPSEUDO_004648 [Phytophthora pseudosyringae]